ncbi:SusC/RagA family TonB-linked outer membrane protein [Flavitalea flava]
MLKSILSTLLLFSVLWVFPQSTHLIRGLVLSAENRQPLPGATIVLNRSGGGVNTDAYGRFSIKTGPGKNLLSVSYIGRESVEIETRSDTVTILLNPSNKLLDEVVTVAYTTVKRSGYPGAVSTISADKINNRQTPDISNALQGLVAGLQTTSSNGQPGNGSTLLIRGAGSINASSDPLFVVDGAPYDGNINALNPADIASVSVLKDATSANLYGSRAANGVIVITTKQGKKTGDASINVTLNQGWSGRAVKDYEQVNTDQYFQLYWQALRNKALTNGLPADQAAQEASQNVVSDLAINPYGTTYPQPVGTDGKIPEGAHPLWDNSWEKAMHQNAKYTQAQLSLSGGSDKSTYYISGGYLNNDGAFLGTGFRRYNLRANTTIQAKSWLRAGLSVSGASTVQEYPPSSDSRTDNVVLFGRTIPSFYPIYQINPDGSYKLDAAGQKQFDYGDYRPQSALRLENLVGTTDLDKSELKRENASARSFLEATLAKGLVFKTTYNIDYVNYNDQYYTNPAFGGSASVGGTISEKTQRTLSYTWNNILTWNHDFNGGHHLDLLAGHEYYSFTFHEQGGNSSGFVLPGLYEPVAASVIGGYSGYADNYNKLSFFGQAQYNYLNRYYLTGSLRSDGSSRFSPQSRWGTFWSAGAGWRLASEAFLKSWSWLNVLTLKTSYGASGNDNLIGSDGLKNYYAYQALYRINNNLGNGGVLASRLPTPDLKWESNLNFNTGLDFGLFGNRLSGTVNYYIRTSKNLLYSKPLASSTGFGSVDANIGTLRNKGIELTLNVVPVNTGNFRWDIELNLSHNKNEVTSLPQKEIISGTKKLMVGKSIYDFFIREWAGVDPATGNPLWYTTDNQGKKKTTTVYGNGTQYYEGSSLPTVFGGITNTFRYKSVELSFLFSYSLGGKILDGDIVSMLTGGASPGHSWSKELLSSWTPEHPNTNVPRMTTDDLGWASNSSSTRFLYNASYARLKNLTLGYRLPTPAWWGPKGSGNGIKLYVTGENLATFFGHKGMDPEQAVGGTTYFQYPAMRTLSVGLQLGL